MRQDCRKKELTLQGLPCKPSRVEQTQVQQTPAPEVAWTTVRDGEIWFKVTESPVCLMMQDARAQNAERRIQNEWRDQESGTVG